MTEQDRDALLERNLRSLLALVGEERPQAPGLAPARAERMARAAEARARAAGRARGGRWWLVVAAAAAAVILTISGLHVLGVLPTRCTTIAIFGPSGGAEEHRLHDGTLVIAAPGARAEARGADDARRVRQLIVLREGEIEVKAPKARPGEVACRVETPEGLWVETVGTVFKVTRAWENDKGERNVDKSKLTGAAIAAMLLVAVSEGEVRTGNAAAEEARVAAGGDAVVKVAEAPKAGGKVFWGQAVKGLQLGVSAGDGGQAAGQPLAITLHLRNVGSKRLSLSADFGLTAEGTRQSSVELVCRSKADPAKVVAGFLQLDPEETKPRWPTSLQAGQEVRISAGAVGVFDGDALGWHTTTLTPGRWTVTANYVLPPAPEAHEAPETKVTSGPCEIEALAANEPVARVSWGQAVNGLQGRLEAEKSTVAPGEDIQLTFWLRADERQKESLFVWDNKYSNGYRNDSYVVKTPDGKEVQLRLPVQGDWGKNAPHAVELKPGVPVNLEGWTGPLKSLKALGLDTKAPGKYVVTGVYEEAGDGKMWGGKLTTGPVAIEIVAPGKGLQAKVLSVEFGRLSTAGPLGQIVKLDKGSADGVKPGAVFRGSGVEVTVRFADERESTCFIDKLDGFTQPKKAPTAGQVLEAANAGGATAPSFSAKCDKPGDQVTAEVAGGVLTLTVISPRGIGGASVMPEKGEWPRQVVVRLALKNLENFGVECGGRKLSGRLGSPPERNDGMAIAKKDEFIEVALPEGFAAGEKAVLQISWIDAYR